MSADPVASSATTSAAEPWRRLTRIPGCSAWNAASAAGSPGAAPGVAATRRDAAPPARVLLHRGAGVVHPGEDRLGARDELGARRGQLDAGGQAQQQRDAQLLLQPAHLL